MRTIFFILLMAWSTLSVESLAQPKGEVLPAKIKPERLQAMRAALDDIESGVLRQRLAYPFAPPPFIGVYIDLAKREHGIDIDLTRDLAYDENGYNEVMLAEIEHRFGRGVLSRLVERAEAEHKKKQMK